MAQYFQPSTRLGRTYQTNGMSHAVVLPPNAQLVIAAGQPGVDPESGLMVTTSPRDQIKACFDSCDVALKTAGVKEGLGAVHKVHSFFLDVKHEPIAMEIWRERYPNHRPTWMSLGVSSMCAPNMLVEIQVEAHIAPPNSKI